MKANNDILQSLYNKILNIHHEWINADSQNDPQWGVKRYCNYSFGPVLGLYTEKDKSLIDILNDDFTDEELCDQLIPIKERDLRELLKAEKDLMTECKYKSYQDELSLLRSKNIEEWLKRFFVPYIRTGNFEIDESHYKGLCYVTYGYHNYRYNLTSKYCGDINVLKNCIMVY